MARTPVSVLRKRAAYLLPQKIGDELRQASEENADEFMGRIEAIIPRGDPENGNLVDSLVKRPGDRSQFAVLVSIGDAQRKHPMHLEGGHKNKDGSHTPAKPFWNPTKAVMRKQIRKRASAALRKAIKEVTRG